MTQVVINQTLCKQSFLKKSPGDSNRALFQITSDVCWDCLIWKDVVLKHSVHTPAHSGHAVEVKSAGSQEMFVLRSLLEGGTEGGLKLQD